MSGASLIDVQGTAASLELTVKTHALNFEHKMRLFSKQKAILFLKRFSNNNSRPIIKLYPTVWMACQCAAGALHQWCAYRVINSFNELIETTHINWVF